MSGEKLLNVSLSPSSSSPPAANELLVSTLDLPPTTMEEERGQFYRGAASGLLYVLSSFPGKLEYIFNLCSVLSGDRFI